MFHRTVRACGRVHPNAGVPLRSTPACSLSPFQGPFSAFYMYFIHKPIIINRLHQNHTDFDTVSQPSHFQTFNGPTPSYVQYMYNTCTIFVRLQLYKYCTNIVHILYNDQCWSGAQASLPAPCGNVGMC